jgi:hypothetical protein
VDLYWLPLGAGAPRCVRLSGHWFEAVGAWRERRAASDLYHSALVVGLDGERSTIEMAPVWSRREPDRGVVVEGPVGLPVLGRSKLFRYEIRRWPSGIIPDLADAVASPQRLSADPVRARQLLDLVPAVPALTWGRDESRTGEMWNSNSVISWLIVRSGHAADAVSLPPRGRAPGWTAGLVVARRRFPRVPDQTPMMGALA